MRIGNEASGYEVDWSEVDLLKTVELIEDEVKQDIAAKEGLYWTCQGVNPHETELSKMNEAEQKMVVERFLNYREIWYYDAFAFVQKKEVKK